MDNTALFLARVQFGITLLYHFWFVALTLGISILIALMETQYIRTGSPQYKTMAKYWGKLFLINYAIAIVTGLVNEFQFGMNWSEYSRFVGSIFGASLAFEAMTAFFVESFAIGVWVYGWDKVSKRVHLLAIWLVAWSANYSAFWILSANSFMQHPVGYVFQNGRLELTDLTALITNPYLFWQYTHTVFSGMFTAGFFMMAISGWYLLNKRHVSLFRYSFKIGIISSLVSLILVIGTGHFYNQYLAHVQPMKFAASEAHWDTKQSAPLIIFAIIDEEKKTNSYTISLPGWLSLLTYNSMNAPIKGIKDVQAEYSDTVGEGSYIPPVTVLFWSFRIMVGIGFLLLLLLSITLWYWKKKQLESSPVLLRLIMISVPLPYLAIATGWVVTEVGRQPWLVYDLLRIEKGLSQAVSTASIWTSLILYTGIYSFIAIAGLYIMHKVIITGPQD